jgi:uncharacterized membrane protein YbhN (UPF0104 family)
MKSILFPYRYKKISGLVFYLTTLVGAIIYFTDFEFDSNFVWIENGILDELITVVLIISGIIHSFSKEKMEDEYISSIRLQALTWSIYVNYSLVLIATLTIFGIDYLHVMIIHLFSLIILFNIRFQLKLRTYYKSGNDEE